ncbi:MAG: HIRAN domain-containing protein [Sphingobium sp.]
MARPPQSLAVVGAQYPNKRGPDRRFEIAMCRPGEPVELRREPKNPADSRAIAVYSARDIQIGYIQADYAQWIGGQLAVIRAVFQRPDTFGAVIRVTFDGSVPVLPEQGLRAEGPRRPPPATDGDDDWPPPEPRDEFGGI